jgi:GAF domain-containing protein/HAMP domain-containing protein
MRLFDNFKNLKLGTRLNILAFLVFSFLLLGLVLTVNNNLSRFIHQAGRQNILQDAQTIQTRFGEIEQETLNNNLALSNIPGLLEAVNAHDIQPVQAELLIAASRLDFDNVEVVTPEGERLFNKTGTMSKDEAELTKLALLGSDATGIIETTVDGLPVISLATAVPIKDASNTTVGALLASRAIDNEMLSKVNVFFGKGLDLSLIFNGDTIASNFDNPEELEYFSTQLSDPASIEQALNGQTIFYDQLVTSPLGHPYALGYTPLTIGADTRAVIGLAANMGELTTFQNQLVINQSVIFVLITLVALIIFALFASNGIVAPIRRLQAAADLLAEGNYEVRVSSPAKDEVGYLSSSFDSMATQIQGLVTGLEQRVAERTTDLELSRQQSLKRANEFQLISEISKIITGEQKLEHLLPLIAQLVSERFNFYHTGIFLIDNTNRYAVLQAANSTGGRNMLERGHKLEIGGSGIVGFVARSGLPRISLDVGQDAVFFNNPDLPNTRSEMALPLKTQDRIVGVLDVQSEKPGAFTDNDINTLSILADQISIALENARLYAQTQQALNEAQALYRQNVQEGWKTFSREKEFIGYQQSLTSGKKLTELVETDEIQQAMNRGEVLVFHADGVTQEASIVVPIKLRGQIIGNMKIKAPTKNRQWSSAEIDLAETVSERLSIALENARLIQESQRQVMKEQTISEVTGKIGASINLKNVLQTAVEELGLAIPGSNVMIHFTSDEK